MRKLIPAVCALVLATAACSDSPTGIDLLDPTQANEAAVVYHDNFDFSGCYGWYYWYTCYETKGVLHRTNTPSGNTNYHYKADESYEHWSWWWGWGYYYHQVGEYSVDHHFHIKKGQVHVNSWRQDHEYTYSYWGTEYTCTATYDYHYANGNVTKSVYDYQCEAAGPS